MDKIKPITTANVNAILPFLEVFEKANGKSGKWSHAQSEMPSFSFVGDVQEFIQALYDNNWVQPFDWTKWQDKAAEFVDSPNLVASADLKTICKLFTTHLRKERFCEGHLASMFENGHILALLKRLTEIRAI